MFLKFFSVSQENNCAGVSFTKSCRPFQFATFLRTPILMNICEQKTVSLIWNMAYKFSITYLFILFHVILQKIMKFPTKSRQSVWFWMFLSRDSLCFYALTLSFARGWKKKFKPVKLFLVSFNEKKCVQIQYSLKNEI